MSDFNQLYQKIINKTLIVFDDFFYIQFYVNYSNNLIEFSQEYKKNFDYIKIKCRNLTKDNWKLIYEQQDQFLKEKLLLMFSIVQTNFILLQFNNNCLTLQSLNNLLKLHPSLINYIVKEIYQKTKSSITEQHKNKLSAQFKRLYNSENGIVLKYRQISEYLQLCSFYEKLGLNYFDLKKLPYNVYQQLLMMINIQNEVKSQYLKQINKKSARR